MAEEDIFMDYAADGSSSPITINNDLTTIENKLNVPQKFGQSYEELVNAKIKISAGFNLLAEQKPTDTRLKVLELRRFNRHLSNIIFEHRKRMNELKIVVDNLNSKLLCQKFEKQHLLNEIKSCLSTKNCFESIELEKEEEEGFEAGIIDPHEKMIHRLHRELAQRQELQTRLISILQKKQETENELMGKKRRIDDLRLHLQNLFKSFKPLIDSCGYDLEAIQKKKMAVDENENEVIFEGQTDYSKNTEECLSFIYEKLVSFVAEKSETEIDFKLRYFPAVLESKNSVEDEGDFNDFIGEEDRIFNNQCPYIQVTLKIFGPEIESEIDTTTAEIYLKLIATKNGPDFLAFALKHESLPEGSGISVSNWLRSLEIFEIFESNENIFDSSGSFWCCLSPLKFQPDPLNVVPDPESFEQVFNAVKSALELRQKILYLIKNQSKLNLEFDRIQPNELKFSHLHPINDLKLTAKISMNSIVWTCCEGSHELVSGLNSIGSKYRSVLDCLQEQIEFLSSHYNL